MIGDNVITLEEFRLELD